MKRNSAKCKIYHIVDSINLHFFLTNIGFSETCNIEDSSAVSLQRISETSDNSHNTLGENAQNKFCGISRESDVSSNKNSMEEQK